MVTSILEWLPKCSNQELMYLCDRHKVPGKAMSRQQMLDALVTRIGDPDYMYRTIKGLSRPHRMTLLAYTMAYEWWSVATRLDRFLQEPHHPYLTDLKHLGFIIGAYSVATEPAEAVVRVWLDEIAQETTPPGRVVMPDPNGPGVLRDIFALIGMAWRRELPLTKGDKLFKKAEEEMLRRMEGSPVIQGDGLKLLVLSYLLNRGVLAQATYDENGKTGFVTTELAWDWSKMTWGEIWTDLADFLLESRADWLRVTPALVYTLSTLSPDAWLPLDRLATEYHSLTGADPQGLEGLLFLMTGLDLLVLGTGTGKGAAVRPSPAFRALFQGQEPKIPGEEKTFVVDPTYSVTVPKTVPPAILCRLERWCGERKADMVLTYKLSQASLRVAMEEGDNPADVVRFFEDCTRAGLPQNVLFSLREWTSGARKARFEHLMLLRLDDADSAQRIVGDKTLRKWIFGQVTSTDLIIDALAVEKVRKRLGEIGLATAPGIGRPGQADSRPRIVWQSESAPDPVPAKLFRLKWVGDDE